MVANRCEDRSIDPAICKVLAQCKQALERSIPGDTAIKEAHIRARFLHQSDIGLFITQGMAHGEGTSVNTKRWKGFTSPGSEGIYPPTRLVIVHRHAGAKINRHFSVGPHPPTPNRVGNESRKNIGWWFGRGRQNGVGS